MDTRIAFNLFGLEVYWYGIILTAGMAIAVHIAAQELQRRGYAPSILWDGAILILGMGILGGRLYHVFSEYNDGTPGWSFYRQNLLQILNFRSGGLGVYGGIVGGGLAGVYIAIRHKVPIGIMADSIGCGLAIGQCIGRWGNYANQELYGPPTGSSWWGIQIQEWARVAPYNDLNKYSLDTHFHPAFLYESLWTFAGFILVLWLGRRFANRLRAGDILALYFIWYGIGRGAVESFFRLDALTYGTGPLPTAVLFSLAAIALGIVILVVNRLGKQQPVSGFRYQTTEG